MGLTIHWTLRLNGSEDEARSIVEQLRQRALNIPVAEVGKIVDLSGNDCDYELNTVACQDDGLRWLLIQSSEYLDYGRHRSEFGGYASYSARIAPRRIIAFTVEIGDGCEPAHFGLCLYPKTINTRIGAISTNLDGWRWNSFCKTQYASNPNCGGVSNFLACHLSVIAVLDCAKKLCILDRVSDEGGFWKERNVKALAQQVGEWNKTVAGLYGRLKDAFEGDGIESAISAYPNVEHLEAEAVLAEQKKQTIDRLARA
jgi:hypothetical protein